MIGLPAEKIAFVASIYRHLEAFHLPFMELLLQKGYEVHAYARPDHGRPGVEALGVICHDIPFQRSPLHPGNRKALAALTDSWRRERPDTVHVHTPVASILGRIAAQRAGVRNVIYTAHGFHFYRGAPLLNWLLYYPIERWMARYTDVLITINHEDAMRARKMPVRGRTVYVPGVGLDMARYQLPDAAQVREAMRIELGLHDDEFVILCIAELNRQKNQAQVIQAVQRLVQQGKPVQCLFAGEGPEEAKLRAQIESLGLGARSHLLGFRRDIPELLAASDVCVLTSQREGLTRSLMEALAAGLPIVTSDVRGNRDLVAHGENGYVVPYGDVGRTAAALAELYEQPSMCASMGRESKRRAAHYDLPNILRLMESIYVPQLAEDRTHEAFV